ncbi:hypothetical protein [Gandjariella thermophila]|uniref:Uncharacterized protein n=1 Tax=Gandjariella thermophila TaxID=1931992 RepID=A0A4D4IW46_9PSEU|nr:hypothetical protein [Gandjariella thermophila]GDY28575.1 hypothetical protein GTS_02080 [Gandjariella thermophila]
MNPASFGHEARLRAAAYASAGDREGLAATRPGFHITGDRVAETGVIFVALVSFPVVPGGSWVEEFSIYTETIENFGKEDGGGPRRVARSN